MTGHRRNDFYFWKGKDEKTEGESNNEDQNRKKLSVKTFDISAELGFPLWSRGLESAFQCRGHRFDPCLGT